MKKILITCMLCISTLLFSTQSFSNEAEWIGSLIGAGSGAILGHSIGGTPESTLLGTTLGATLGFTIGHFHGQKKYHTHSPYFYHSSPHYYHHNYNERRKNRNFHRKKHLIQPHNHCRIVKYRIYKHGHPYSVKKTICKGVDSHDKHYRGNRGWRKHYE